MRPVTDLLALLTVMVWPVIPLFWIPVHGLHRIFRRLGALTYVMPLLTWVPLAFLIFRHADVILGVRIVLPLVVGFSGWVLLLSGMALQVWTGMLLGLGGLAGRPEVIEGSPARLVVKGPYTVVRHPTYVSHTLMFFGLFLATGIAAVGAVTLLDLLLINAVVIPLEDRELVERFGGEYEEYRRRVPAFFPTGRQRR